MSLNLFVVFCLIVSERATGPGGDWHKTCLCCKDCNKRLDSTLLAEHDGEAYCKSCHGKNFGPKGYGFSAGAGGLMSSEYVLCEIENKSINAM